MFNIFDFMKDLNGKWEVLLTQLEEKTGEELDLKSILFLIGVQELGQVGRDFDKDEKTDLFHIAVCKLLCPFGYYKFERIDERGCWS